MQAKVVVSLNPFPVPETVTLAPTARLLKAHTRADFWQIPLSDLDPETLHRLCEEFRDTVFFRADKPQPPEAAPPLVDTAPALAALDKLQAVLCDPEGAVCVAGEDEDREAIAEALYSLATFVVRL